MTEQDIISSGNYYLHHTASASGYVSRKTDGYAVEYHGKFGDGYKVFEPRFDSTRVCWVKYYIKK